MGPTGVAVVGPGPLHQRRASEDVPFLKWCGKTHIRGSQDLEGVSPRLCTPFWSEWPVAGCRVHSPSIGCSLLLFLSWAGMVGAFVGGTQSDGALASQVLGGYLIQGQGGVHCSASPGGDHLA